MLQTVFHIPHELLGLPVFGRGWALLLWAVGCGLWLAVQMRRPGWRQEVAGQLPFLLVVGAAIWLLLPVIEERRIDGVVLGLPIRGYGTMLLLAVVAGVGLAVYQARRMGLDPDVIFSLAFCMFVAGIAGARLFYVIQYWERFRHDSLLETVAEILKFTEGGLVVYGALVGGLIAAFWFLRSRKLPVLAVFDLIAPSLVLGLAIGRIGCFLNGCCHGGLCQMVALAVTFPPGSPPYIHQLEHGELVGLQLRQDKASGRLVIASVTPGSLAAKQGLKAGDRLDAYRTDLEELLRNVQLGPQGERPVATALIGKRAVRWTYSQLPKRSQPIHPTQLYSAVDAAILALLLWSVYPFRRRDGEVIALLLTLYPITRFIMEMIRDDEVGKFGTGLTISQLVSLAILASVAVLWVYIERQPRGSQLAFSNRP